MAIASSSYPLLEVFWTMLIFFAFVVWLWILFGVLTDLFRRHDIGAFAKVIWIILLIIAPYLGVFVYLILYHNGIAERSAKHQVAAQQQMDDYLKSIGAHTDPADRIAKAKALLDSGTITQAEFDQMKQQALAG